MKKQVSRESRLPPTVPVRASRISARAELTPLTSHGPQLREQVTPADIVDIGRYLNWADKAMEGVTNKKGKRRKGQARPKAA